MSSCPPRLLGCRGAGDSHSSRNNPTTLICCMFPSNIYKHESFTPFNFSRHNDTSGQGLLPTRSPWLLLISSPTWTGWDGAPEGHGGTGIRDRSDPFPAGKRPAGAKLGTHTSQ